MSVSLEKLEPQGITFGPVRLLYMNERENEGQFDIHPGDEPGLFVDVIQKPNRGRPNSMYLMYAVGGIPNEIKGHRFELVLLAQGEDVPSCRRTFIVCTNEDGVMEFRRKSGT